MRGTRPGKAAIGGVKLPFESPSAGNGYAASGEVVTYTLPPEEIERIFGQAEKPKGKAPLNLRNPYQREANEMAKENRLERLKKVLTKEEYLAQKEKGIFDADICGGAVGYVWTDCMNALKKEWGLVGTLPNPGNAKRKEEIKQAVKVDIGPATVEDSPQDQAKAVIFTKEDCEELQEKMEQAASEALIKAADKINKDTMEELINGNSTILPVGILHCEAMPDKAIYQRNVTALDAADEFYTLQEDLDVLDEEISRLTKERVHTTDRMKVLKAALEGVTVAI